MKKWNEYERKNEKWQNEMKEEIKYMKSNTKMKWKKWYEKKKNKWNRRKKIKWKEVK